MNNIIKSLLLFSTMLMVTLLVATPASATTQLYSQGTVMWQSVPGATHYNIYYKESSDKTWMHAVRRLPANASSYTIMYLKRGVPYWYMVTAKKEGKEFWWSTTKKLSTMPMK
ncbi:fibronectin type III domain-containing protein [Candidatus Woesebacteria bacterium]|nr:fibronectin type III domain-containing protein [Candidatus Woesebacteria bacterium]